MHSVAIRVGEGPSRPLPLLCQLYRSQPYAPANGGAHETGRVFRGSSAVLTAQRDAPPRRRYWCGGQTDTLIVMQRICMYNEGRFLARFRCMIDGWGRCTLVYMHTTKQGRAVLGIAKKRREPNRESYMQHDGEVE